MLTKIGKWLGPRRSAVARGFWQFSGLGCFAGCGWTVGAADLNVTVGLGVTGALCFVVEWLVVSDA